jgi:hypothetical protein
MNNKQNGKNSLYSPQLSHAKKVLLQQREKFFGYADTLGFLFHFS